MKTIREQITGRCQHVTHELGRHRDKTIKCKAGVSYYELCQIDELGFNGSGLRSPCSGEVVGSITRGNAVLPCERYESVTPEQIEAEEKDWEETARCLTEDISKCCKAPVDHSQAITKGEHKGHGPRFCSKCKKLLYRV